MSTDLRVARVWRYPVKSLLGQQDNAIEVSASGVAGDRRYALRDPEGRLGSGKNSGRLRKIDGLLGYRARYEGDRALVTLPDGTELDADDPNTGTALADALGRPLTLEREDDGSHLDAGPLHLLTTASLAWLQATLPGVQADERRFRPNLVIDAAGAEPVEQGWIGRTLRIGEQVVLRITEPTERCGMVALEQEELPRDPRVLRHITQNAGLMFGVYAEVVTPGTIRTGDPVTVDPAP